MDKIKAEKQKSRYKKADLDTLVSTERVLSVEYVYQI